jgi:hypothetical protein
VPRALNMAYDFANRVAIAAYAYALSLYYQAIAYARSIELAAYMYALSLYYQAIAYASAVLSIANAYAAELYASLRADIAALDAAVSARLAALATGTLAALTDLRAFTVALVTGAVTTVEGDLAALDLRLTALIQQYAQATLKDALTITDQAAVVALTDIWPHLVTDVEGLINDIPQELIDIRDRLAAIPRAIPGDLVDALSALGVLAIPLLRYLRECGVPMCRDLHGLSDLFGDLNSVATDAALVGLFALMVADPHGAADIITGTLGPVAHGAASATRELIGG